MAQEPIAGFSMNGNPMDMGAFFAQGLSPCCWTRPYWPGTSRRHGLTLLTGPALEPTDPPMDAPAGALLVRLSTFPVPDASPVGLLGHAQRAPILGAPDAPRPHTAEERVFFGGVWHPSTPRWVRVVTQPSAAIDPLDTYARIVAEQRKGARPVLIHLLRRI